MTKMIKKFNKYLAWTIVIIGFISVLPSLLMILSPIGMVVLIFIGMAGIRPFRRLVFSILKNIQKLITGMFNGIFALIKGSFKLIFGSFSWLFGLGTRKPKDAKFMGWFEKAGKLKSSHKGLLVDGVSSRLSQNDSYESCLVQGGMGRGVTSTSIFLLS